MVQKSRRQLIVKICCIIAAFILWLYTSNDDNTNITYKISNIPIEIVNEDYLIQSGLTIVPNQKFTASLKITGKPSEVYSVRAEQFKLTADLSIYALKKGENRIPINIIRRPNNDINIVNDGSMWISIKVDNYTEKNVPIQVKVKGNSKNGFNDGAPVVKPETALISGAEQYVNSVTKAIAEVELDNPDKNINLTAPLKAVDEQGREVQEVRVNPKVVDVTVPIQKVKEVGVNVKTTGDLPKDLILRNINLSKEKIVITGDPKELLAINKLDTEPIDLSKLKDEKSKIKIKLVLPKNIKLVDGTDTIDGEINLDRVVEKNLTLDIKAVNLQNAYSADLDKKSVSIVVSGGKTAIGKLTNDVIKCYVNLESLGNGDYTVPINIELPQGISIISQNYKFVKASIKEKTGDNVGEKTQDSKETSNKPSN